MPVKIARSAPRPSFGLPELLVAIQPRVSLAARPEKREYLRQFGSHPGNPGCFLLTVAFQLRSSEFLTKNAILLLNRFAGSGIESGRLERRQPWASDSSAQALGTRSKQVAKSMKT